MAAASVGGRQADAGLLAAGLLQAPSPSRLIRMAAGDIELDVMTGRRSMLQRSPESRVFIWYRCNASCSRYMARRHAHRCCSSVCSCSYSAKLFIFASHFISSEPTIETYYRPSNESKMTEVSLTVYRQTKSYKTVRQKFSRWECSEMFHVANFLFQESLHAVCGRPEACMTVSAQCTVSPISITQTQSLQLGYIGLPVPYERRNTPVFPLLDSQKMSDIYVIVSKQLYRHNQSIKVFLWSQFPWQTDKYHAGRTMTDDSTTFSWVLRRTNIDIYNRSCMKLNRAIATTGDGIACGSWRQLLVARWKRDACSSVPPALHCTHLYGRCAR